MELISGGGLCRNAHAKTKGEQHQQHYLEALHLIPSDGADCSLIHTFPPPH